MNKKEKLNIYELQFSDDHKLWIAAYTAIQALKFHEAETDVGLIELNDNDDIVILPKEKWDKYKITNPDYDSTNPDDNWKEKTFKQAMENMNAPDWIAGTIFY